MIEDLPLSKQFEYNKQCRNIDNLTDINELKNLSKNFLLLYLTQQYVVGKLAEWEFKSNKIE